MMKKICKFFLNNGLEKRSGTSEMEFAFAYFRRRCFTYLNQHVHEAVLILSDINMPGMSGLELLRHIKQKYAEPPPVVMMITAYGDAENYNTGNGTWVPMIF